jgi:hypothetical protein
MEITVKIEDAIWSLTQNREQRLAELGYKKEEK